MNTYRWAHPRSRGENSTSPSSLRTDSGSSPLTRGKPSLTHQRSSAPGLIPAHAGKTVRPCGPGLCAGAHPRSRGENWPARPHGGHCLGSSPLTRGKPTPSRASHQWRRLIPAHAGKTSLPSRWRRPARAHPRSRGENAQNVLAWAAGERLIPAHAGKTSTRERTDSWRRAHPRSRGENQTVLDFVDGGHGSSPLTRGKPQHVAGDRLRDGLIPAHAGKTTPDGGRGAASRAHPRSRGENKHGWHYRSGHDGSSPLTRGKRRSSRTRR